MSHTSSRLASWLGGKSIGQRLNIQARAAVILCVAMVVTSTGGSLVSLGIMKKDNEMAHGALTAALLEKDFASLERDRSEEHTSELQSLMRISYAVFCLKKKKQYKPTYITNHTSTIKTHKHIHTH